MPEREESCRRRQCSGSWRVFSTSRCRSSGDYSCKKQRKLAPSKLSPNRRTKPLKSVHNHKTTKSHLLLNSFEESLTMSQGENVEHVRQNLDWSSWRTETLPCCLQAKHKFPNTKNLSNYLDSKLDYKPLASCYIWRRTGGQQIASQELSENL